MNEATLRLIQSDPLFVQEVFAPLPSVPYSEWDLNTARKFVATQLPFEYHHALGMYLGDHWQGGWGYCGPMVDPSNPAYPELVRQVRGMFTSRNVVAEIADTHINSVVGRPVKWSLSPIRPAGDERDKTPDSLKQLIAEASVFVRQWVDARKLHAALQQLLLDLLLPSGRGVMRLLLPRGGGQPLGEASPVLGVARADDFGREMSRIYIEKPDVRLAHVYTDPETMREIGIVLFRARSADGRGEQDAATLMFLDASGERTIVRTVYQDGRAAAVSYDMGGRIPMIEVTRPPLITPQLLQQNRILNYAESIIPRNLTTAGFLERILISTQLNGTMEQLPDGSFKYTADPNSIPNFGPAEVTVLQPHIIPNGPEGQVEVTTPQYIRGEPVLPNGSIDSSDHIYHNMLRESGMAHLVPNEYSDAALLRYTLTLLKSAEAVIRVTKWAIGSALAWAEDMQGTPGKYTNELRVNASCFLNLGSLTPEQLAALTSAYEKSIFDKQYIQEASGVEDVDEMNDRIASQPGAAIDTAIRMANTFKMLRDAGLPPRIAAKQSGYSEKDAEEMQAEFEKEQQRVAKQQTAVAVATKPPVGSQPSRGTQGLTAKRRGRPSGTAERQPGQGQDPGARALQTKKNNRSRP